MRNASLWPQLEHISVARISSQTCAYCGSIWEVQRDHVIPCCYLRERRRYEGDWLVPCCGECNRNLGSHLIFNVPDRATWLLHAYEWKYRKLLRAPLWADDEIAQLGPNLKRMVVGSQKERKDMEFRMQHLRAISAMPINYLSNLRPAIDPADEDVPEFVSDDVATARQRRRDLRRKAELVKQMTVEHLG